MEDKLIKCFTSLGNDLHPPEEQQELYWQSTFLRDADCHMKFTALTSWDGKSFGSLNISDPSLTESSIGTLWSLWARLNINDSHAENIKPFQPLGQKNHAVPGSIRAMITEEKRFTALLSNIGFPDMCLESFVWWLTTMPIVWSKPGKR